MSKNEPKLTLTVKQDRALGYHRGGSMRYLSCNVKTPEVKQEQSQDQHLNLALVIDASGSMQGYPLQAACNTAIELVNMLHSGDYLSVVSFADDFITHLDSTRMDEEGKWEAERRILQIASRGATVAWRVRSEHTAKEEQQRISRDYRQEEIIDMRCSQKHV